MAVLGYRELASRGFTHKFGESPSAERKFALTLDDPATTHQAMIAAVGIVHGTAHPEWTFLYCVEGQITENAPDPYHVEITYKYEPVPYGTGSFDPNPLARPDVWSFSTSSFAAAAYSYYQGAGNATLKPLTATNGERIQGAMYDESEMRATINGNRANFPLSQAVLVTGALNDDTYANGAKHCWKCVGLSGQQAVEMVNNQEVRFWQVTVELAYRAIGWPLLLPNVGTYYISGNNTFSVFVRDKLTGEDIPTTTPQPLDANGGLKFFGGAAGEPDVLVRRVNPEVNFQTYFGSPPNTLFS